jgi:hypothetical protein
MTNCRENVDILNENDGGLENDPSPTAVEQSQGGQTWTNLRASGSAVDFSSELYLIDFQEYFGNGQQADKSVYLHTYCMNRGSPAPARLSIGSNDCAMAWVNGEEVFRNCDFIDSGCQPVLSRPFSLNSGYNRIVLRVDQSEGEWGGIVRLVELATLTPIESVLSSPLRSSGITDCNWNEVADEADIASSTSQDANLNVVPDECEVAVEQLGASCPPPQPLAEFYSATGKLSLSVDAGGSPLGRSLPQPIELAGTWEAQLGPASITVRERRIAELTPVAADFLDWLAVELAISPFS